MVFEKKTTALNPAVGAAAEQSSQNMYVESIADLERKINEEIDHPGVCEVDNAGGNLDRYANGACCLGRLRSAAQQTDHETGDQCLQAVQ